MRDKHAAVARHLLIIFFAVAIVGVAVTSARVPISQDLERYLVETNIPRKALVIGVSDYDKVDDIPSAKHDAQTIREKLESLNFDVTYVLNPGARELWQKIKDFQNTLKKGDVSLFYFSGHGFQWKGLNFLAPADVPKTINVSDLPLITIPVDNVILRLKENKVGFSLLLLDACRANNIRIGQGDDVPKFLGRDGLADVSIVPPQLVIGFAAAFGQIAIGSKNPNESSLYTKHLYEWIGTEGEDIFKILRTVAIEVNLENEKQSPETRSVVSGDFYPNPNESVHQLEKRTWRQALQSGDRAMVTSFLYYWPVGRFAPMARQWLADKPSAVWNVGGSLVWAVESGGSRGEIYMTRKRGAALSFPNIAKTGKSWPKDHVIAEQSVGFFEAPSKWANRIAMLAIGEVVKVSYSGSSYDKWTKVVRELPDGHEQMGYVKNAFEFDSTDITDWAWVSILLKPSNEVDILGGIVPVKEIRQALNRDIRNPVWDKGNMPDGIELGKINQLIKNTNVEIIGSIDFPNAVFDVRLATYIEGAKSQQHASQLGLLRALQIRRNLIAAGASEANISINMPNEFDLEPSGKANIDEIRVFSPSFG